MRTAAALLLVLAAPAMAQELPPAASPEARALTLDYAAGGLFHVPTSDRLAQTVIFAPGEAIQSVVVSEPAAYAIGVSGSGDRMTVTPSGISALAVLKVQTDRRQNDFELAPARAGDAPQVVRFSYASRAPEVPVPAELAQGGTYRQSGDKSVRPSSIGDDGDKTYIIWDEDQAMPAVFAIGPSGKEEMVEGYMRGGIFTIDRVYDRLVFRIDGDVAKARRDIARVRK